MPSMPPFARQLVVKGVAILLCVGVGTLCVRPHAGAREQTATAAGYAFSSVALNTEPAGARTTRTVQPALQHIQPWIAAVGAAVALADLRGLGRDADACLVDPRDDSVTVRPVPGGGGPQYPAVRLPTAGVRYDATMAPMGCVPADLDEDGDLDLLVYYWGRSPLVYLNRGDRLPVADSFAATELVRPMQVWNSTALNVGDVDGDGHLDVLVGNYFPDGAKVLDPTATDDSRMAMQSSMGLARNGGTNRLLLTRPTGRPNTLPDLQDVSDAVPDNAARAWTLAFGLQDLTGDQLPEVYQANDFGPDQLLVNASEPGHVRFFEVKGRRDATTPKSNVLGHDSFKGMGVTFGYSRGDTRPSIMVSNITDSYALEESNFFFTPDGSPEELASGRFPYREQSQRLGLSQSGWSWDVKAADFDNDGRDEFVQATGFVRGKHPQWSRLQELAMGNDQLLEHPAAWPRFGPDDDLSGTTDHNRLWASRTGGGYADVAPELGLTEPGVSRGVALGDVNGDGRLDLVVANQWADSSVHLNTGPAQGRSADLALRVPGAAGGTRPAIGATVTVAPGTADVQRGQLYPANGHAGVSAAALHLAIAADRPAQVSWRDAAGPHTASFTLSPGHSTLLLLPDGTVTR